MTTKEAYKAYHENHKNIIFDCIKNNHCFLRKFNGVTLSAEPMNLLKVNTPKYTSLNGRGIGVQIVDRKLRLVKQLGHENLPSRSIEKVKINKNIKKDLSKVAKVLTNHRSDLFPETVAALHAHSRIIDF